jgi:hypothetical protein
MPDQAPPDPTQPPVLPDLANAIITRLLEPAIASKIGKIVQQVLIDLFKQIAGLALYSFGEAGALVANGIAAAEDEAGPAFTKLAGAAVQDLFGVAPNVPVGRGAGGRAGRTAIANEVGDMLFKAFSGGAAAPGGGPIEPTDAPAKAFLSTMTQLCLEGWLEGWVVEALSFGQMEQFGELDDIVSHVLGLGRASAAVHGPLVRHMIVTPLDWKLQKEHRPTLLGASACARQVVRHPEQREVWLEDLRRQGYSETRIDALLNEQAKFHSVSDVFRLQRAGTWTESDAVKHLADQGYAADVAGTELQLEKLRGIESFERSMATTAVDAFADGRIDETTLAGFCTGVTISDQEKAQYLELAHARRICGTRPLSPSEAAAAVRAGVLSFIDYRRALERDGRDDEAITVLELMLRAELDAKKDVEEHRRELEAQRAAEKAARERAALDRKAAADARLALDRRGRIGDLEQAYVRGLIPLDRVRELYAATYDGDTVAVLDELLQSRRVEYVARQEAAEKAKTRGSARGVNVGELETAVVNGVLTLDQFRQRLDDLHFERDDADLLTATLRARLAARDDAERKRDAAAAAAKIRHVDLATFELLVRRGHRSLADYAALLRSLNFDDGAVAALVERLQILIDDDAATAAKRQAAEAKLQTRGLSLEQFRRAVLLGAEIRERLRHVPARSEVRRRRDRGARRRVGNRHG